jgi:hypothetical protein
MCMTTLNTYNQDTYSRPFYLDLQAAESLVVIQSPYLWPNAKI